MKSYAQTLLALYRHGRRLYNLEPKVARHYAYNWVNSVYVCKHGVIHPNQAGLQALQELNEYLHKIYSHNSTFDWTNLLEDMLGNVWQAKHPCYTCYTEY